MKMSDRFPILLRGCAAWIVVTLGVWPVLAADWSGFMGPNRNGRSDEKGLLTSWPEGGPQILWRQQLGDGYSSTAIVDGRAFTLFAADGAEWAVAFDTDSGQEMWRTQIGRNRRDSQGGGPRSTPMVDGELVCALGAMANLHCLDVSTGEKRWGYDLEKDYGARVPQWGVAASPIIEGDLLIVPAGGSKNRAFLAFDKTSGELVWGSGRDLPSYASPIVVTIGDVRQAVFFMTDGLVGVGIEDGARLWTAPWRTSYDVNSATPIFVPKTGLFISSGYDTGGMLIQVVAEEDGFKAYQVWRNRVMRNHFNSSVRVERFIFGFDESILKCVDVLNGEEKWRGRAGSKGSLIYADGHLLVLGGDGVLSLVEATPEDFVSKAKHRIVRDRTWASPALSNGVLYIRAWNELIALRVGSATQQ